MPNISPKTVEALRTLFFRIGKQLRSTEFVADTAARELIKFGSITVPCTVIGYAIGHDGQKHKVVSNPATGQKYLLDNNSVYEING